MILNIRTPAYNLEAMKKATYITALLLGLFSAGAAAACTAEFKAKRGGQYVHTTMSVPSSACSAGAAKGYISSQGYTNVMVVRVSPG